MTWDYKECCILYAESLEYLRNSLGIVQVDIDNKQNCLLPYQVAIIKYINKQLIELGTDDLKARIEKIFEIFDYGSELISSCGGECQVSVLADEVDADMRKPIIIDEEEVVLYRCCRFVYSWTNFLTALCIRLKFQYAYLFAQDLDGECCKCGSRGEDWRDYESWVSNVFPQDELYDRTNYFRANGAWEVSKDRYCDCYRHATENSSGE